MTNNLPSITRDRLSGENKRYFALLSIVVVFAFFFRVFYFESDLPLTFDSLGYFLYAIDTSVLESLPPNYSLVNNGWPVFLSVFFSASSSNDISSYMQIQRLLSITLSALTVIPIYFLCRTHFSKSLSVFGAALFALEPRIIQNSLLGITEPLYILLGASSLVFFLNNGRMIYVSFAFVALASIVRAEALLLLLPYTVMYFVKNRKDLRCIPKYLIAIAIVILILLPMASYRIEVLGYDGLTSRFIGGVSEFSRPSQSYESEASSLDNTFQAVLNGLENYARFFAWNLVPIFIFFVPVGCFLLFKNLNFRNVVIIFTFFAMSVPAFFAYSYPHLDTRYLYFLYPIFCFVSLFPVKKFATRFHYQKFLPIVILGGLIMASSIFMSYKGADASHQIEANLIAEKIAKYPKIINEYYPEDHYLEPAQIPKTLEELKLTIFGNREKGVSLRSQLPNNIEWIPTSDFSSIEEFITESRDGGLSHIIADDQGRRPHFLADVFANEHDYPYLVKEFDSKDENFNYHLKMFKIDYEKFSP